MRRLIMTATVFFTAAIVFSLLSFAKYPSANAAEQNKTPALQAPRNDLRGDTRKGDGGSSGPSAACKKACEVSSIEGSAYNLHINKATYASCVAKC